MNERILKDSSLLTAGMILALAATACKPINKTPTTMGEQPVPHYKELVNDPVKFDAAMLKCKEVSTYEAQLNSEWCAVTRKASECETHRICPEK